MVYTNHSIYKLAIFKPCLQLVPIFKLCIFHDCMLFPTQCCDSVTHTHLFNGPFSGITRVSRYQKGKTNLDFTEARDNAVTVLGDAKLRVERHSSFQPAKTKPVTIIPFTVTRFGEPGLTSSSSRMQVQSASSSGGAMRVCWCVCAAPSALVIWTHSPNLNLQCMMISSTSRQTSGTSSTGPQVAYFHLLFTDGIPVCITF